MNKNLPLIVAGIIFSLVALIHLLRLLYHWEVVVAGYVIPFSLSSYGLIITIILALWMYFAASRKN